MTPNPNQTPNPNPTLTHTLTPTLTVTLTLNLTLTLTLTPTLTLTRLGWITGDLVYSLGFLEEMGIDASYLNCIGVACAIDIGIMELAYEVSLTRILTLPLVS